MTCPICDQKPMNCDCTATERQQYSELSDMEDTVASLQAEIERLRSQPCPYVTGSVTRYCTLTPLTLTDAEREAIQFMLRHAAQAASNDLFPDSADYIPHHKVIFAMMERLGSAQ